MKQSNNSNRQQVKRNKIFSIPMQLDGYTARGERYNPDDLIEILSTMKEYDITHLISIPVYSRKHLMYDNPITNNRKSNIPIGYILDIDLDAAQIKASIFEPFYGYVEKFIDPVVSFRVILDKNDKYLRQIIAIDITPSSECDYSGDYSAFVANKPSSVEDPEAKE